MEPGFAKIAEEQASIHSASELTQHIISAITDGLLAPGLQLPAVNKIAALVGLNRLTVLKSLDELENEGWITKKLRSGCFVAEDLPLGLPQKIGKFDYQRKERPSLVKSNITELNQNYFRLGFSDGYPDHRLFPSDEMARIYSNTFKDFRDRKSLLYHDVYGHEMLRDQIGKYIRHTRSIRCDVRNVFIARGSTMGIYLIIRTICNRGDSVAMASPGYYLAREAFNAEGLNIFTVKVDNEGLDTDQLERTLQANKIKLLYVTPHHQYPTTVTMPASRRMELLRLAEKYDFYIIEDDYDFDFQYDRRPILPVSSIDQLNRVLYIGGFSKSLSPAIRVGYVIAHEDIIREMGKWRKIIDRQGDTMQEIAFAKLLEKGIIAKTIRKAIRVYQERRDFAYELIRSELSHLFEPSLCKGGLAFWTRILVKEAEMEKLHRKALSNQVYFMHPDRFSTGSERYTRLGFANMNEEEVGEAVEVLKELVAG